MKSSTGIGGSNEKLQTGVCDEHRTFTRKKTCQRCDYRYALVAVKKHPEDDNAKRMVFECERFFRSKAFGIYCDLDGEALMYKIQDEVDERSTQR